MRERGNQLRAGLDRLVKRYPDQLSSRGWGLLQGLVLKDDCGIQAVDVVKAALEEQLLLARRSPSGADGAGVGDQLPRSADPAHLAGTGLGPRDLSGAIVVIPFAGPE